GVLVPGDEGDPALLLGNRDGDNLFCEFSALDRGDGPSMALEGETVLLLAGDLRADEPQVLRGLPHGLRAELLLHLRVREAPSQGRVPGGEVAHRAVRVLRNRVRGAPHALDAARHEDVALAALDRAARGVDPC